MLQGYGEDLIQLLLTLQNLEELFRDEARNTTSLEIINVVFAGSLAFQALDRITGESLEACG